MDEELGETDLMTHSINTGDASPVKTLPQRLPYVLHQELEKEMRKLTELGCIEPSNSSALDVICCPSNKQVNICTP